MKKLDDFQLDRLAPRMRPAYYAILTGKQALHYPRSIFSAPMHYMYPFCYDYYGFIPIDWLFNRLTGNDYAVSHYTTLERVYPVTFLRYFEHDRQHDYVPSLFTLPRKE